jgi:hypothetical protein
MKDMLILIAAASQYAISVIHQQTEVSLNHRPDRGKKAE